MDDNTRIGAVRLRVADKTRVAAFYEEVVGLRKVADARGVVKLGAGGHSLVELVEDADAPARPAGTTGLFHLALLVPDRIELARSIKRVVDAGCPLTGASDHLVSEAIYLDDPEGNGIEIYRDRERTDWDRDQDGTLKMASLPLDLRGVMAELKGLERPDGLDRPGSAGDPGLPDGTRIGHVHLNVADLEASRAYYVDGMGFDVMVDWPPSALFVSAGGYHHHLGLNTWQGEGAPAPPKGSLGLVSFEIVTEREAITIAAKRLREGGFDVKRSHGVLKSADPSSNPVSVRPVAVP